MLSELELYQAAKSFQHLPHLLLLGHYMLLCVSKALPDREKLFLSAQLRCRSREASKN